MNQNQCDKPNIARRALITGALSTPLASVSLRAEDGDVELVAGDAKTLVAYYSRTGNTKVIAGQISRAYRANLFEIATARPYPADYEATVSQAQKEAQANYEPKLKATISNIRSYDLIFLGFPIWGMTAPPAVRSFLSKHNLAGKRLVPFITHGGYGIGRSLQVLSNSAPQAQRLKPFVMEADQERRTMNRVKTWLKGMGLGR